MLALNARTGHVAALVGTLTARLGAPLTMIDFVLAALGPASVTNLGALAAEIMSELGTPAHPFNGPGADVGTVTVESNAVGHHCHVLLTETGRGTMLAFLRTLDAGGDARLKLFLGHETNSLSKSDLNGRTITP